MRGRITAVAALLAVFGLSGCASLLRWERPPPLGPASGSRSDAAPRPSRPPPGGQYRVRAGDTLYSIAFRHQVDYRELAQWNGIGKDYRILPGQVLNLAPSSSPPPPASRPPAAARPSKPAAAPAAPPTVVTSSQPAEPPADVAPGDAPAGFEWLWPTAGQILRTYAPQNGFKGLDFGGNLGQPVFAAAPGRVVYSGNALKGYGELIIIRHNDTFLSAYGYNRKRNVKEGDVVTAGQPIAELGLGPENKPFLHFEIRERGQPVDPMRFLPKRETTPGLN